ncbi:MAG TPA: fructosamine kinase family protein [Kofleriaceae bacterium]|nr:fructosamine kinase family protein [Kofleriaceae bacterium]
MTWRAELAAALGPIAHATAVAGGDVNEAWRVELADGARLFVKTHAAPPPGLYAAEAAGLAWLAGGALRVPRVIAAGERFLALEWLALGPRGADFDAAFGRQLAALHARGAPRLGLDGASYLATLAQDNAAAPDVATWWVERRLRPTIARLADRACFDRALDRLAALPDRFGPAEPPARLHGDLWWGNVGACDGAPVIFDPAVYGGPREIDLAMLALFGPVSPRLIAAYEDVWPLADGWRARRAVWQLYPLAVHAVLFGGSYTGQLARGLDALT